MINIKIKTVYKAEANMVSSVILATKHLGAPHETNVLLTRIG